MEYSNYWKRTTSWQRQRDSLCTFSLETDVVIIGAGIAGLSAAWWLNQQGTSSVILEKEEIASGATGNSAGMLSLGGHLDYSVLAEDFGISAAKEIYDLTKESFFLLKQVIQKYKLDCRLEQPGSLYIASKASHRKIIEREYKTQKELGIPCEFLDQNDLRKIININSAFAAVRCLEDGAVNPLKLCQQLADLLEQKGVRIFEKSQVQHIGREDNKVLLHTRHGVVIARVCFIMADGYFPLCGFKDRKLKKSKIIYSLATAPLSRGMKSVIGWQGKEIAWNSEELYDYFRVLPDDRIIFGTSTEQQNPIIPEEVLSRNRFYLIFPQLQKLDIQYCWGGMVGVRDSPFPFVGRLDKGIWGSGGYNGEGILMGFLAGKLLSEAFLKKKRIPPSLKPH